MSAEAGAGPVLVVSAHAGDFVWRAGGAMALASSRGAPVTVLCLSFGERGESARAWRDGMQLAEIKALRRGEAERAAGVLGATLEFLDAGDYPLRESAELVDEIVRCYRRVEPAVVLTHALADPYNPDHPAAARMALQARVLAQAIGYDAPGDPLGAPREEASAIAPPAHHTKSPAWALTTRTGPTPAAVLIMCSRPPAPSRRSA